MKYYASSKLKHRDLWKQSGLPLVSTWHQAEDKLTDVRAFDGMWQKYLSEMNAADSFVMLLKKGEVPKGALVELGMAFSLGLPIKIIWGGTIEELADVIGTIVYHQSVTILKDMP